MKIECDFCGGKGFVESGEVPKVLAMRVRLLRKKRGLTQEELSRMTTITRSSIANIEGGLQDPTLKTIGSLAAALEVEVVDLLT